MSVQAGVWNFSGEPPERTFFVGVSRYSTENLSDDGETTYFDDAIGMLYRPFHTTFESRIEHQPHVSTAGKVVTFDGRLDNRAELISELCNELAEDRSDVGIVAAAFDKWAEQSFAKLVGDWAVTVWDALKKELILARDYIGVRRLFYYLQAEKVRWCTHLAPLALCGDEFTLCDKYIAGHLASRLTGNLTPYREIMSVPPGNYVRIHNRTVTISAYWSFDYQRKTLYNNDAEYEEHFRHLLCQAVRRRLRSDSPILADLSGGLDSSSIVCMADDIFRREGPGARSVDTFSITYLDEPEADDCQYFIEVERGRGRMGHHAEIRGTGDTFPLEPRQFYATPVYAGRTEVRAARMNVMHRGSYRVTLSGMGGDEFLGQVLDPRVQMGDSLRRLHLRQLATQLVEWSVLMRRPWTQVLAETLLFLAPTPIRAWIHSEAKLDPWVNTTFARAQKLSTMLLTASVGSWSWRPSVRHRLQTYTTFGGILTNAPPSLGEARYPYLDQTLAEFLMSIPSDQLYRPGDRRSLMRRAMANLLPRSILSRRTKQRENRCYIITLQKHWNSLYSMLSSPISVHLGYINQVEFQTALLAAKIGQFPKNSMLLLRALFLELWLQGLAKQNVIRGLPGRFHVSTEVASSQLMPASL